MNLHPDVKKVLVSDEDIANRCKELGKEINDYYVSNGDIPIAVGLLKGSVPFMAQLVKNVPGDIEMDFMDVSSYTGTESTEVKIIKDLEGSIRGRAILLVEDIIDTGKTIKVVKELLYSKGAKDVKIVALLDKPEGRLVDVDADWVGFEIPDEFVIGYGLDYNQKYRNLPYVGVIKESAI